MRADAETEVLLERALAPELGFVLRPWPGSLYRVLDEMARAEKTDPATLIRRCLTSRGERLERLVAAATVPHTSFFRHREQLEHLGRFVLPRLAAAGVRPVRIWSAGCATGEEAYSLALTAEAARAEVSILATDVCAANVAFARRGRYEPRRCTGLVGVNKGAGWTAPTSLRRSMRFEVTSLVGPHAAFGLGPFHVVFCRNVLVYFALPAAEAVLARLARELVPDGSIVVSPVETMLRLPPELVRQEPFGWLGRAAAAAVAPEAPPSPPPLRAPTADAPSLLEIAARRLGSGELDAAEEALRRLIESNPEDGPAWFLLGETLLQRSETAQARAAFLRAAEAREAGEGIDVETLRRASLRRAG